jgi:hypothetical protein
MRTKLWGALLALALIGVAWAGKGKLDGKTYKVTITEPDKKSHPDTLSFKNGTFDSSECQKYGFKPTSYSGDAASFTATAKSDKEGTMAWSGTIKGDAIDGTFTWSKPGQPTYVYSFSGASQK